MTTREEDCGDLMLTRNWKLLGKKNWYAMGNWIIQQIAGIEVSMVGKRRRNFKN